MEIPKPTPFDPNVLPIAGLENFTAQADQTRAALAALGHEILVEDHPAFSIFGGAQAILRVPGGYVAGSDPRKDGQAVGF
jgi:gamma-glutamyltranspeptidase/glutathione hydrolase